MSEKAETKKIKITVTHKIECGELLCEQCEGCDTDGRDGAEFYCMIFLKGLPQSGKGIYRVPKRLKECKEAEKLSNKQFLNKLKSINLSSKATPTRRKK